MRTNSIIFCQGDTPTLTLQAIAAQGSPIDLTGSPSFMTSIKGPNGESDVLIPDNQHAVVDALAGLFTVSVTSDQSNAMGLGLFKNILTIITIGGVIESSLLKGVLAVNPAEPIQ